ncbi:MAG: hypothetical protein J6D37_03995 [Clostridia bacterium]|nr:hypothetical protein [Clostridia bacterium]
MKGQKNFKPSFLEREDLQSYLFQRENLQSRLFPKATIPYPMEEYKRDLHELLDYLHCEAQKETEAELIQGSIIPIIERELENAEKGIVLIDSDSSTLDAIIRLVLWEGGFEDDFLRTLRRYDKKFKRLPYISGAKEIYIVKSKRNWLQRLHDMLFDNGKHDFPDIPGAKVIYTKKPKK